MKTSKLFLTILLFASVSFAQPSTTPAAAQKTYVHAGHMLDVKTGKTLDNVLITIEGDKITAIGSGAAPAGATVIDLPNATLLPGLIDAHTHLTGDPNFGYQELGVSIPKEALIGAKNARITLQAADLAAMPRQTITLTEPDGSKDEYEGVAVIELHDPPANTYTYEMMRELDDAILNCRLDDDVHVIVIRGAGDRRGRRRAAVSRAVGGRP